MNIQLNATTYENAQLFAIVCDGSDDDTCEVERREVLNAQTSKITLHIPRRLATLLPNIACTVAAQPQKEKRKKPSRVSPPPPTMRRKARRVLLSDDDTDVMEHGESKEQKEAKYTVQDDNDPWPMVDRVEYMDRQPVRDSLMFVDMHGTVLDETNLQKTECIVTEQGELLCVNRPNFIMFAFLENEIVKYAPGRPVRLDIDDDTGDINLTIQWLKSDKECTNNKPSELVDLLLEDESSLPADCACTNLAHMTHTARSKWMSEYAFVLSAFKHVEQGRRLGCWSQEVGLSRKTSRDDISADLMDYLEFYSVKPRWIWRTSLGVFIWDHFLQTSINFGLKPRHDLVTKILNARTWSDCNENPLDQTEVCGACGKQEVVGNRVILDAYDVSVGFVCLRRMRYIADVGNHIRAFREHKHFDMSKGIHMIVSLHELFTTHKDSEHNIQQSFRKS